MAREVSNIALIFFLSIFLIGCPSKDSSSPSSDASTPSEIASSPAEDAPDSETLTGALQADVQFDKESYFPGDEIEVTVIATGLSNGSWVGVIPSSIPHGDENVNDQNDLSYVRPTQVSRVFLVAPSGLGEYDIRLNSDDDGGVELASRSFRVTEDPDPVTEPSLELIESDQIVPGGEVKALFKAPSGYSTNAWIGIVPTDTEHGPEEVNDSANLGYEHLQGRRRGKVVLTAPGKAGTYDLRMFTADTEGKESASLSFEVGTK